MDLQPEHTAREGKGMSVVSNVRTYAGFWLLQYLEDESLRELHLVLEPDVQC